MLIPPAGCIALPLTRNRQTACLSGTDCLHLVRIVRNNIGFYPLALVRSILSINRAHLYLITGRSGHFVLQVIVRFCSCPRGHTYCTAITVDHNLIASCSGNWIPDGKTIIGQINRLFFVKICNILRQGRKFYYQFQCFRGILLRCLYQCCSVQFHIAQL